MIIKFFKYSLKDKFVLLIHILHVLKTQLIYRLRFKSIGGWSSFNNKLYMTHSVISLGKKVTIGPHARIEGVSLWNGNQYNPHIIIEDGVSIQQRCHIAAASELIIGKDSMLSFDVMITDVDHEYSSIGIPIGKQGLVINKTRIGERCFIGAGAKIMAGTILGEQCVVGSNAVVRGKFPAFCVIAGAPARVLKRYDEQSESWQRTDKMGRFL
jgi:acetyltransferase-like isoleucine patch superfamily enzyme